MVMRCMLYSVCGKPCTTEKAEKPADKAPRPSSSKAVSIDADDFDDLDEE